MELMVVVCLGYGGADGGRGGGGGFLVYGTLLIAVPYFKYLGRILLSSNNNWPALEQNLRRSRRKWGRMVKILGREGADRRMPDIFYVALVQTVIFWGQKHGW